MTEREHAELVAKARQVAETSCAAQGLPVTPDRAVLDVISSIVAAA